MFLLAKLRKPSLDVLFKSNLKNKHYLLVPEILSDNVENNCAMKEEKIPCYKDITPMQILRATLKRSITYEFEFELLLKQINDKNSHDLKCFQDFLNSHEEIYAPLEQSYKLARHLAFIHPYSEYMSSFFSLQNSVQNRKNMRWSNLELYGSLKKFENNIKTFPELETHILKRYKHFFEMNGINASDSNKLRIEQLNLKIFNEQTNFKDKLNFATKKFSYMTNDKALMSELPIDIQRKMSIAKKDIDNGPWIMTLDEDIYQAVLIYSSNQKIRKLLFDNYNSRASNRSESIMNSNSDSMKNIINYRNERAKILGFKNHIQFALIQKSANNVESVEDFLEAIRSKLKPINEEDYSILQNLAFKNKDFTTLNAYDINYWRRKHHAENFGNSIGVSIMEYLPFKHVLKSLLEFSKLMFGVDFVESTENKNKLWNDKLMVYDVYENGNFLSTLIIDPYVRSGKINDSWAYSSRDSSKYNNSSPIAHLMLDLTDMGQNTVMSFPQLDNLVTQFGKCLQILLTKVKFTELSDLSGFESDGIDLNTKFFKRLLFVPEFLNKLSSNIKTNEKIPEALIQKIASASTHMISFDILNECYYSAFDIECHTNTNKYWNEIADDLYPKYKPSKLTRAKEDIHFCQCRPIFAENFAGSIYSNLWSEMLAADIFEAFKEVGFSNDDKIKSLFKRYRETFLFYGNSLPINEIFRRFRGRNPSFEPFIDSFKQQKY